MANMVLAVCATQDGTYTMLKKGNQEYIPVEMTVSFQTLDSAKSGRDNNTGKMFRDKVAEKLTAKITIPAGVTNSELAPIMTIITAGSFWAYIPNPKTGFSTPAKNFYCATVEPPIEKITAFSNNHPSAWTYDEFELSFVEM